MECGQGGRLDPDLFNMAATYGLPSKLHFKWFPNGTKYIIKWYIIINTKSYLWTILIKFIWPSVNIATATQQPREQTSSSVNPHKTLGRLFGFLTSHRQNHYDLENSEVIGISEARRPLTEYGHRKTTEAYNHVPRVSFLPGRPPGDSPMGDPTKEVAKLIPSAALIVTQHSVKNDCVTTQYRIKDTLTIRIFYIWSLLCAQWYHYIDIQIQYIAKYY